MSPHTKWYTLHTVDKCNHCVCQSTDQDYHNHYINCNKAHTGVVHGGIQCTFVEIRQEDRQSR